MIDAKELRIGNWVEHTNCICNPIMQVDISLLKMETNTDSICEQLEPILLTPKILEKCGFVLAPQRQSIWIKDRLQLWLGHTGCLAYIHNEKEQKSEYICQCVNLHSLQNLYYCIMETELNYTP